MIISSLKIRFFYTINSCSFKIIKISYFSKMKKNNIVIHHNDIMVNNNFIVIIRSNQYFTLYTLIVFLLKY